MRFVTYWDEKLINMLEKCGNPKKSVYLFCIVVYGKSLDLTKYNIGRYHLTVHILTTYPVGYELNAPMPTETKPPLLIAEEFGPEGMLRLKGKLLNKCFDVPIKSIFWVSGFAFSYSTVIQEVNMFQVKVVDVNGILSLKEKPCIPFTSTTFLFSKVPYDCHLPYLFFGEETLMNVRLWTHGYDFYAPGRSIVYHLWDRSYRPTFRQITNESREQEEKGALNRAK